MTKMISILLEVVQMMTTLGLVGEKPNQRKNPKNQTKKQLPKMEKRKKNHFLIYIVEMMTQIPAPYLLDLDFLNQNLNHMFHHEKVLTGHVK